MSNSYPELQLPDDLIRFLSAGHQLVYNPDLCDVGALTLLPLSELKLARFPVETCSLPLELFRQDPHYGYDNSYLVLGVNLVAYCAVGYEPEGLLIWLPTERRYGIWDCSIVCCIWIFGPEVTWERIVANPVPHINAGSTLIYPESRPMENLIPWPSHPYHTKKVYSPQPI